MVPKHTMRDIVATTRVDRHGDRFTREALEEAVAHFESTYIPVLFNHDPRVPPLGRSVEADVEQLELDDGEWGLIVTSEMFDMSATPPPLSSEREMSVRTFALDQVTVVRDRSYRHEGDAAIFDELTANTAVSVERLEKKALEPISASVRVFFVGAAAFVTGILNKMSGDTWEYAKPRIAKLLAHRKAD